MTIAPSALDADRDWAAGLMAGTDPWITLGRGLERCQAACRRRECELIVARQGDERCGFALLDPRGVAGSPYLVSIAVAAPWRSRGVGAALLDWCEQHVAPSRHFFLCVSSFNERARAFYERQGFRQVGEFPDYIIDGASERLMYKRLG